MDTPKFVALAALAMAAWQVHAAGDAVAGKAAFVACASCHQLGPSARAGFGPQLNGIFGRRAGSTPDFRYSAAMKGARIIWTEHTLTAFIKNPERTVPGTSMRFFGLGYSDRKIADLLAYLRTYQAAAPGPAGSQAHHP